MEHFCNMYKNPLSLYLWSKNIILQLYEISHSMWIHRNNIVHEDFKEKLNRKESEKLKKAITDEYGKGHSNIMSHHKYMFQESLTLMEKSVVEKNILVTHNIS